MELVKTRTGIEEKFYNLCMEVVPANDFELYDMEYIQSSSTLRIYIMDTSTSTAVIEDCVKVDRALSPYFEESNWIPNDITLEVSSPGIYRPLKVLKHFEAAIDKTILVAVDEEFDSSKIDSMPESLIESKEFRGKLISIDNNKIKMDIDGFLFEIGFNQLQKASLDPEL